MKMQLICLLVFILFFSQHAVAGKKRCQSLLTKLQNIQAQQRQGYSAKKGISLQARADKARDKWWRCENTSKYSKSQRSKKGQRKSSKKQSKSTSVYKENEKETQPFISSQAIVIKSRFKGKKQQAWLNFYQQPKKCKHAKSTAVFAFCIEDKAKQQEEFNQHYQK